MPRRILRLRNDRTGRMPFAFVALVLLLISGVGFAYLGFISRDSMVSRGLLLESDRLDLLAQSAGQELESVYLLAATEAVSRATQEPMSDFNEDAEARLSRELAGTMDAYLQARFEAAGGTWTRILPYATLTIQDWDVDISYDEKTTIDSVPVSGVPVQVRPQRSLDTETAGLVERAQANPYYRVTGFANVTVTSDTGVATQRTITVDRLLRLPFPFLTGRFDSLQAGSQGSNGELARVIRYVLTTLAQWRVFQGYGVPDFPSATEFDRVEDARDILTTRDVEVAVNLALLLEEARHYRTIDADLSSRIWSETGGDYEAARSELPATRQRSTEVNPVERELEAVLDEYLTNGTMDPSDIVALYSVIDSKEIPLDLVLAQAINSLYDQLVLRYLRHFNLADLSHITEEELRQVQFIERDATRFVDWLTGKVEDSTDYSHDLVATLVEEGQTADPPGPSPLDTPPDRDSSQQLHQEYGGGSAVYLMIHDATVDVGTYHSTWMEVYSKLDGACPGKPPPPRFKNELWRLETISGEYQVEFREQNIFDSSNDGDWTAFFEGYYKEIVRYLHEELREGSHRVIGRAAQSLSGIVDSVLSEFGLQDNPYLSLEPGDAESVVEQLERKLGPVLDALRDRIGQQGKSIFQGPIDEFHAAHKHFRDRVNQFLWDYYDSLVDKEARIYEGMHLEGSPPFWEEVVQDHSEIDVVATWYTCYSPSGDLTLTEERFKNTVDGIRDLMSSSLYFAVEDDVREAYELIKRHETEPGSGDIAEAFDWIHENDHSSFIDDHDKVTSLVLGSDWSGVTVPDISDFGLVPHALDLIGRVATNLVVSQDGSNSKIILPVNRSQSFSFWDGRFEESEQALQVFAESAWVRSSPAYLSAEERDLSSSCRPPDCVPPSGTVWVDWNRSRSGGGQLEDPDIFGKHYAHAIAMAEAPFEALWNISLYGHIDLQTRTQERSLLGPGSHGWVWLNKTMLLDFTVPVTASAPWRLRGVNYVATWASTSEVLDFMVEVLDRVWEPLAGVAGEFVDSNVKAIEFLRTAGRSLLRYPTTEITHLSEMFQRLIEDTRDEVQQTLAPSLPGAIADIDSRFATQGFEFCEFGNCYRIRIEPGGGPAPIERRYVVVETIPGGWGEDTNWRLEFVRANGADGAIAQTDLFPDSGTEVEILLDPMMAVHPRYVQLAGRLPAVGDRNLTVTLHVPTAEPYYEANASFRDLVESAEIPVSGIALPFDVRATLRYPQAALDAGQRRELIAGRLAGAIEDAWAELLGSSGSWSWGQVAEYVKAFAVKLLQNVLPPMDGRVHDLTVSIELQGDVLGTNLGPGDRVSFVLEGSSLDSSLRWLEASAYSIVGYLANGDHPASVPALRPAVPEAVHVRFESLLATGLPPPMDALLQESGSCTKPDVVLSAVASPNLAWLAMPSGKDAGAARVTFGVRAEGTPGCLLAGAYDAPPEAYLDLWLLWGEAVEAP